MGRKPRDDGEQEGLREEGPQELGVEPAALELLRRGCGQELGSQ